MASRRIPSLSPPCLKTVTQKLLACECRDSWQQPPILLPGSPSSRVPFASLAAFTPPACLLVEFGGFVSSCYSSSSSYSYYYCCLGSLHFHPPRGIETDQNLGPSALFFGGLSENYGSLFWGPYNKDPTSKGTLLYPTFGNPHIWLRSGGL